MSRLRILVIFDQDGRVRHEHAGPDSVCARDLDRAGDHDGSPTTAVPTRTAYGPLRSANASCPRRNAGGRGQLLGQGYLKRWGTTTALGYLPFPVNL